MDSFPLSLPPTPTHPQSLITSPPLPLLVDQQSPHIKRSREAWQEVPSPHGRVFVRAAARLHQRFISLPAGARDLKSRSPKVSRRWQTSSARIPATVCKCDTLYRQSRPGDTRQEEGHPTEHPLNQTAGQPLPNQLYSYRKRRLSSANNTIKANCCCVWQPFYWRRGPWRVGVIDCRCSSCVSRWSYNGVDGQDEVSGFLLQVSHMSTGASASSFCSFIIFHPSQVKDDSLFNPLLHHHQFSSSLAHHLVSKV